MKNNDVKDMVNHPKHYISNGLEVIDVIEAFTAGLSGIEATDTGNIIKYACRWKEKNGVEDLKKLVWYANHLIEHLENKEPLHEKEMLLSLSFDNHADAEEVLDGMIDYLKTYGFVSNSYMRELMGIEDNTITGNSLGWYDLSTAKVVSDENRNYYIKLPKPILYKERRNEI